MTADTLEYLLSLSGGDRGVAKEILGEFLASDSRDRENLSVAITARDAAGIQTHAHRIKGAARSVGATAYADAAAHIEEAASNGADLGSLAAELTVRAATIAAWAADLGD